MVKMRLGRPEDEVQLRTLRPGDPFRYDSFQSHWVYGHLMFANSSRARVVLYGQPAPVEFEEKVAGKYVKFQAKGDYEQNLPLEMRVESLADDHHPPTTGHQGSVQPKPKEATTMADTNPKAAGLIAKYAFQQKTLAAATAAGDTKKAEVATGRIAALEAEAAAAGVELPAYDSELTAAKPKPVATPVIEKLGKQGEAKAIADAKAKAAAAKKGGVEKGKAAAPKEKKEKKPKSTHDCLCGCGNETASLYAPGHDARVKGILLKVERGDLEKSAIPETVVPFVKFVGKWKTEGFKLTAAPVKVPGRDEIENTSLKALEALDV